MGKYKAVRPGKKASQMRGAIPCLLLIIFGMALVFLLFYAMLKSANT